VSGVGYPVSGERLLIQRWILFLLVSAIGCHGAPKSVDAVTPAPVTGPRVVLPSGAREVRFEFGSADYRRGRIVTWLALLLTVGLLAGPAVRSLRRRSGG